MDMNHSLRIVLRKFIPTIAQGIDAALQYVYNKGMACTKVMLLL